MRYAAFACALLLSSIALAQGKTPAYEQPANPSWIPRPILFMGPSLLGSGYQWMAANVGSGFILNSRQLIGDFEAHYTNAKKTNDGTFDNHNGHERFLQGRIFIPCHKGLYFGGGAQWSETATTNYTKKGWRPTFGAGQDYFTDGFNMRWQILYITKGTDRLNAVQGPEIQLWMPTPASKTHFFYRQTLGIYEFHATVSDFSDPILTARQTGNRSSAAFADFSFGWRF